MGAGKFENKHGGGTLVNKKCAVDECVLLPLGVGGPSR